MKVTNLVTYEKAEKLEDSYGVGLGGWFDNGMRWEDYLKIWEKDHWPVIENIRAAILKEKIRCSGEQHQYGDIATCPVFEDGTTATYSLRAWGDLMAAIYSTEDDKDYSYFDFYV